MEEKNILFRDLGLSEAMLKALEKKGYGYPTTIQQQAIPAFLQWRDVIAKAPTGTGKTFAFGIPMIEHVDPENEEALFWHLPGSLPFRSVMNCVDC